MDTGDVVLIGKKAYELLEKMPTHFSVLQVVQAGQVADESLLFSLMSDWKSHAPNHVDLSYLIAPTVCISVPSYIDPTHVHVLQRVCSRIGYGRAVLLPEEVCLAAYHDPELLSEGVCVIDGGAGKTSVTCISGGGVIGAQNVERFGNSLDSDIVDLFEEAYGIQISLHDAMNMKHTISLVPSKKKSTTVVRGKNIKKNSIETMTIKEEEIIPTMEKYIHDIALTYTEILQSLSSAAAKKIHQNGILLCGGLSKNEGVRGQLEIKLQTSVTCIARPDMASVIGASRLHSQGDSYSYLRI